MQPIEYHSHPPRPRRRFVLRRRIRPYAFVLDVALIAYGLYALSHGWTDFASVFFFLFGIAMLGWHIYLRLTAPPTPAEYAKKLVKVVKAALESPVDRQRVGPEAFEPVHIEFYDRNQRALEAIGFRLLGDWMERTSAKRYGVYTVVRTLINGDGTIIASISESAPVGRLTRSARATEKVRKQKLLMTSRFSDGVLIHTTNDPADVRDYLPNVHAFYKATQVPADLLAEHRNHLEKFQQENPDRTLVRTQTLEEIFRRLDETKAEVAEHKRRNGYLTAQQYRKMLGHPPTAIEEAVAVELEKLKLQTARENAPKPPPLPTSTTSALTAVPERSAARLSSPKSGRHLSADPDEPTSS